MATKRVIAGWTSTAPRRVLDDGSEWAWLGDHWEQAVPPLPPEALGEVEEVKAGDEMILDGRLTVIVRRVDKEFGTAWVTWGAANATCNLSRLTKVQP